MNFFTVGFLLANLQLNPSWTVGYALKTVGALFMLGGIAELGGFAKETLRLRSIALLFLGSCIAAVIGSFVVSGGSGTLASADSAVNSAATAALAILFFIRLGDIIRDNAELFCDEPAAKRFVSRYRIFAYLTAVAAAADIVNRLTGGTAAADASGVVILAARLAGYVMLILCGLEMNRLRISFDAVQTRNMGFTDKGSEKNIKF